MVLFALLLIAGSASAQGTRLFVGSQKKTITINATTSGLVDTTVVFSPPKNSFFGEIKFHIYVDSTGGGFNDSLDFTIREGYLNDTTKVFSASDGSFMDWFYLNIYDAGATGTVFTNFDWDVPLTSTTTGDDAFKCVPEMGKISWQELFMRIQHKDQNDSTSTGTITIDLYSF